MSDKILCSAIWIQDGEKYNSQPQNIESGIVFFGHRHNNIFPQIILAFGDKWNKIRLEAKYQSGFLTEDGLYIYIC